MGGWVRALLGNGSAPTFPRCDGVVGLGWGWEFVKHGIDRTEPLGEDTVTNLRRPTDCDIWPHSGPVSTSLSGSTSTIFPLCLRRTMAGMTATRHFLFLLSFPPSGLYHKQKSEEAGKNYLSAHSTALERLTTASRHTNTHTHIHFRPNQRDFPYVDGFSDFLGSIGISWQSFRTRRTKRENDGGRRRGGSHTV